MRSDARVSRGRMLVFRIVGWLLGVATIGLYLPFVIIAFVSDDPAQTIHRFHVVGSFFGIVLIGVFSIVFVMRPDWIAAWHVLVAQALAYLFGGLMGGDLISGFWITGVVGLVLLGVLAPDRRALLRLPGHPSVALLTYALLCSIAAWIYAVTNAELQRLGSASRSARRAPPLVGGRDRRARDRGRRARGVAPGRGLAVRERRHRRRGCRLRARRADLPRGRRGSSQSLVMARGGGRHRPVDPHPHRGGAGGPVDVTSRRRSPFRRFERWLVGVFMAVLVFVLERLVMRQIRKKEAARDASTAGAVTVGEG